MIPAATDRPKFTNTVNVTAHADAAFAGLALAADAALATRSRLELAAGGTRLNLVVSGVTGTALIVR